MGLGSMTHLPSLDLQATDVVVGNGFVEFGTQWRLGDVDGAHFSLSHKDGKTAMIWRDDGTQHPGPRSDYGTWSKSLSASNVALGDRFIQLGSFWRVGDVDGTHMSIGEANTKKTAVIYRRFVLCEMHCTDCSADGE